ncbi:MAG: hypothetical protein HYY50_03260 [Candidatus Kerfeldbacteria bacterium]|nr:hypothetical protein [Candidatus Kerfeldbacteria bacterium]
MKWHLTIFLAAATLVGLLWFDRSSAPTNPVSVPVLYYTKGTVEQFDGTPRGSFQLFRIPGFDGRPKAIGPAKGNTYLPAPIEPDRYRFTRTHNFGPGSANFSSPGLGALVIGVLPNGDEVVTNPPIIPNAIYPGSAIMSPDDRFFAQSAVICTESVEDGPCPTDFVVNVYDYQTGKVHTFNKENLKNPELGGYQALLSFLTPTQLLIDVEGTQERSGQYFYLADLESGVAELVYTNLNTNGTSNGPNYQVIDQIDRDTVFAFEWNFSSNQSNGYVEFNYRTRIVRTIDRFAGAPSGFPVNRQGFFFSRGYNQGLQYRDFLTHTTRTLFDKGELKAVSQDGRYAVMSYPYSDGGYNSERLELWDIITKRNRVIYDQHFGSGNSGSVNASAASASPLKVGDTLFGFVSLEVNGEPALENPLN